MLYFKSELSEKGSNKMGKTRVGIINVTGYAGVELARLLCQHPEVELTSVTGRSAAGQELSYLSSSSSTCRSFFPFLITSTFTGVGRIVTGDNFLALFLDFFDSLCL